MATCIDAHDPEFAGITLHRQRAFTLIELVGVMIIIGTLAVFAMPRFFDKRMYDAREFFDQSKTMLRHAQKLAVAGNRSVFVRLDGASIALCFDAACARRVAPPAGQNSGSAATLAACGNSRSWFCEAVPNGISYTALDGTSTAYVGATPSLFFNALGTPFRNVAVVPVPSLDRPLTISVTGDGTTRSFILEPETGYVH